jgi:hypothetical protein
MRIDDTLLTRGARKLLPVLSLILKLGSQGILGEMAKFMRNCALLRNQQQDRQQEGCVRLTDHSNIYPCGKSEDTCNPNTLPVGPSIAASGGYDPAGHLRSLAPNSKFSNLASDHHSKLISNFGELRTVSASSRTWARSPAFGLTACSQPLVTRSNVSLAGLLKRM